MCLKADLPLNFKHICDKVSKLRLNYKIARLKNKAINAPIRRTNFFSERNHIHLKRSILILKRVKRDSIAQNE